MNYFKKSFASALLALLVTLTATAQVGIGTTTPATSAQLEVSSTSKGFLPPRMTTSQRNQISNPVAGLIIYNTTTKTLQLLNGSVWVDVSSTSPTLPNGSDIFLSNGTASFSTNSDCASKSISLTPCSSVSGATINDDVTTTIGIEYDWSNASSTISGTGFGAQTNTRALVEINGQCWARFNLNIVHSTGNSDCANNNSPTNGRLYNWAAAMNNSTTERAQGLCPAGWHVPSDCEWKFLEHSLGMSISDQNNGGLRLSGSTGSKISSLTSSGTNATGFTSLLPGFTNFTTSSNVGTWAIYWSSSFNPSVANSATVRYPTSTSVGIGRSDYTRADGFSVRCLKD